MKLQNLYSKPISLPVTQAGVNFGTWDPSASITDGISFGENSKLVLPSVTEATRLASTPVESEIFYDETSKILYYGDGTTQGGVQVGSGAGGGDAISLLVAASVG